MKLSNMRFSDNVLDLRELTVSNSLIKTGLNLHTYDNQYSDLAISFGLSLVIFVCFLLVLDKD